MQISRQEQIDKMMCKPGYTWNETLGRCLGAYAGPADDPDMGTPKPPAKKPTPDDAIKQEIASRESTGEVAQNRYIYWQLR